MDAKQLKEYIINNNKVEKVLTAIGCSNIKKCNKYWMFKTPTTNINTNSITNELKVSQFSEDEYGDIYTLTMKLLSCSFIKALKSLHEICGLKYEGYIKKEEPKFDLLDIFKKAKRISRTGKQEIKIMNEEQLEDYIQCPYMKWINEGILPGTQSIFGIGYHFGTNRVVIPHRWWCGSNHEFVGMKGRTLNPNFEELRIPKYLYIQEYPKTQNVYGINENYVGIQKAGYCVVYESEKSVMKRHSKKDYTGTCIMGHSMSLEQAKIIISLNVDVIISMDKDVPIEVVRSICENFYGIRPIYYTWDEYNMLDEKDSLADKNNKIYDYIFKRKVKYDENEHKKYIKWLEDK